MKKILFPLVVLFLLLPVSASHASDRTVAKRALQVHQASTNSFAKVKFSAKFQKDTVVEAECLNTMLQNFENSTEMSDEEKFGAIFGSFLIWLVDFTVDASREKPALVNKEATRLQVASGKLLGQSSSARSKKIARSLQGHALVVRSMAQLQGGVSFCQIKQAIEDAGGYTYVNFESALDAQAGWTSTPQAEANMKRGSKMVDRGIGAMERVKPSLPEKLLSSYSTVPSMGMTQAEFSRGLLPRNLSPRAARRALELVG